MAKQRHFPCPHLRYAACVVVYCVILDLRIGIACFGPFSTVPRWRKRPLTTATVSQAQHTEPAAEHPLVDDDIKTVPGPFSANSLRSCWQKKPLVIRNAFDSSILSNDGWPSREEFVELAFEDDAVTRLIRHVPEKGLGSFTLELGPFCQEELEDVLNHDDSSSSSVWTLVVNDVEQFHPSLSDWMDQEFRFLPRWRRDDAQISLACKRGGIGPHVDNYDVFLIQMAGTREWTLDMDPISVKQEYDSLLEGLDVRILQQQEHQQNQVSLELQPGDCLYLPPRFVHCGMALTDDCMTLSVGCRAPSAADLVSRLAQQLVESTSETAVKRYQDEDLLFDSQTTGELTASVKQQMRKLTLDAVQSALDDESILDQLVGELVTQPNRPRDSYPVPLGEADNDDGGGGIWGDAEKVVEKVLKGHGALFRAEGISFAYSVMPDISVCRLFTNGEMFEIQSSDTRGVSLALQAIVNGEAALTRENLLSVEMNEADRNRIETLLETLVGRGLLYGAVDEI